nr:hypothetical protein [Tanacetum cinerariifolium]
MLMQGTSLTEQERECKLYDAFDKFAYQKGETLRDFYLRFSLLLNDMNMYNMKLEQFQFVSQEPSSLTHSISYPVTDTSSLVNHNAYMASSSAPQIAYAPMVQQSSEYSPPEAGLVNFVLAGSSRPFTLGQGGAPGKQRVITCYNSKGEGHMSKKSIRSFSTHSLLSGVRLMNERTSDPLALISQHQLNRTPYPHHQPMYQQSRFQPQATSYQSSPYGPTYHNSQFASSGPSSLTHSISYPGTDTSSLVNHNACLAFSSAPQIAHAQMDQQSSEYSPPEAGLVVPVFQKGDDPIDAINHMMSFLTSVVASRYPATNNQLRTSSNPRQQATINNGQVLQEEELEFLADPDRFLLDSLDRFLLDSLDRFLPEVTRSVPA